MENITKEELIAFINNLLDNLESRHSYVDELFEERTESEQKILELTKYNFYFKE